MKTVALISILATFAFCGAQNDHVNKVDTRGDKVMGFSHEKTTHHFRTFDDGGAIQVIANDPADMDSIEAIRSHLKVVASEFSRGDLHMPVAVHNMDVPGLGTMKRLHSKIAYKFMELPDGGMVRLTTTNAEALKAIHAFIALQITDHRTGDPMGDMSSMKAAHNMGVKAGPDTIACAVTGQNVSMKAALKTHMYADYKGNRYFFCCGMCPDEFKANPAKFAGKAHLKIPK